MLQTLRRKLKNMNTRENCGKNNSDKRLVETILISLLDKFDQILAMVEIKRPLFVKLT